MDAAGTTSYTYDSVGRLADRHQRRRPASRPTSPTTPVASQPRSPTAPGNARVVRLRHAAPPHHRRAEDRRAAPRIAKIAYGWDAQRQRDLQDDHRLRRRRRRQHVHLRPGQPADVVGQRRHPDAVRLRQVGQPGPGRHRRCSPTTSATSSRPATAAVLYSYTPRGTLSATVTSVCPHRPRRPTRSARSSTRTTSPTTHQDYTYDALGPAGPRRRARSPALGNDLAADGAATYTRDPSGDLLGEAGGATKRLAWTDLHTDVVGQFTATGTTLAGSTTYDPLGKVLATRRHGRHPGLPVRVHRPVRPAGSTWRRAGTTPATGQFDTRDSAGLDPSPDSVRANRFAYGDANPLTDTDPTGHWGLGSLIKRAASAVVNTSRRSSRTAVTAVTNVVTTATVSWVADRIDDIKQFVRTRCRRPRTSSPTSINVVKQRDPVGGREGQPGRAGLQGRR